MLDVEYLLKPPAVERPLVYCYRSGILRASMKQAVKEVAEKDGDMVFDCAPDELPSSCMGGGLFSGIPLCDWPAGQGAPSVNKTIAALQGLCIAGEQRIVLFVRKGSALLKRPEWLDAERSVFVVEEPAVGPDTLLPILECLINKSRFVRGDGLLRQAGFLRHFEDLIADQEPMELPQLVQEFDKAVLRYIDPGTGIFSGEFATDERRTALNRIMRPLRAFVEHREATQLSDLLRGLATRFPGSRSGGELADELAHHTLTLLTSKRPNQNGAKQDKSLSSVEVDGRANVLIWSALLLAMTSSLSKLKASKSSPNGPDLVLVRIDQMGREFLRRSSLNDEPDPLSGLWRELNRVILDAPLDDGEASTVQGKLLQQLACHLNELVPREPIWIERLRSMLREEHVNSARIPIIGMSEAGVPDQPLLPYRPRSFADLIGHQVAADGLRRSLDDQQHNTPLILFGPEGVGKRTLGRFFAKGLLCEGGPAGKAPPCDCCEPCRQFETGSLLDFVEFDAGAPYAVDYVQEKLLANLRYESFSRRRPIIISNPDKSPRLVDMCLKTLEAHSDLNRFIFTVIDLKAMSLTGQSRCEIYRLAPLSHEESRQLGRRLLEFGGFQVDERVLDIVVAEAAGLPRRLSELCSAITRGNGTTLDDIRVALKLNWAEQAIAFWRATLLPNEGEQPFHELLPVEWQSHEAIYRVRLILEEIYRVFSGATIQNGSLLHVDGEPISELVSLLSARAKDKGMSFEDLWSALAQQYVSCDQVRPMSIF